MIRKMRFDELELEDELLDGLYDMNFQEMTPVQEHTIPVILEGRDIIGCAQTGTGKTAAYTLPLLNRLLLEGNEDNVIKSVIIVPTRELAQQIDQQFQGFSYYLPISTTVVYGGGDGKGWDVQKRGMLMGSDVVIATPGRMISHIQNSGIDLSHVECLILDEADRMLDMGFSEDIMKIVSYMPKERQTIMFSATLPPKIRETGQDDSAQSRRGEYRHFETQRGDRPVGLCLLREPEAGHHPRDVRRADRVEDDHLLVVEAEGQGAGAYAQAHETQRGGHALRPGAGAARGGDARLQEQQGRRSWWLRTSWRAASTSRTSDWSSITTCRTTPRITSTASAVRRVPRRPAAAVTFVSEEEQGKFHAHREVYRAGYPQGRTARKRGQLETP